MNRLPKIIGERLMVNISISEILTYKFIILLHGFSPKLTHMQNLEYPSITSPIEGHSVVWFFSLRQILGCIHTQDLLLLPSLFLRIRT